MPNLETFLEEWGSGLWMVLRLKPIPIRCTIRRFSPCRIQITLNNDFLGRTENLTAPVMMPNTRPIEALYEAQYNFTLNVITQTYSSAVLYPTGASSDWGAVR